MVTKHIHKPGKKKVKIFIFIHLYVKNKAFNNATPPTFIRTTEDGEREMGRVLLISDFFFHSFICNPYKSSKHKKKFFSETKISCMCANNRQKKTYLAKSFNSLEIRFVDMVSLLYIVYQLNMRVIPVY